MQAGDSEAFSPLASVVFLGIPGFAEKTVTEQARMRTQLDEAVAAASSPLDEADRVVLDAPEGAVLVVLGNPRGAFQAAQRALAGASGDRLAVGINHGPVSLMAAERRNASRLIGDGIDAALSIAGFVPPGGLMISRAFHDALAEKAPALAAKFQPAGIFTDAHVRAHELYSIDGAAVRKESRRYFSMVMLACAGILAIGVAGRFALQNLVESRQPAVLQFDVKPQGDIYVDGVMKGRAPALALLQVPAGAHTIEIRHGKYPPFVTEVDLGPGEQLQVKHSFIAPVAKRNRSFVERLKFWQ